MPRCFFMLTFFCLGIFNDGILCVRGFYCGICYFYVLLYNLYSIITFMIIYNAHYDAMSMFYPISFTARIHIGYNDGMCVLILSYLKSAIITTIYYFFYYSVWSKLHKHDVPYLYSILASWCTSDTDFTDNILPNCVPSFSAVLRAPKYCQFPSSVQSCYVSATIHAYINLK